MSKVLISEDKLTDIADAIRERTGVSGPIAVSAFSSEIQTGIPEANEDIIKYDNWIASGNTNPDPTQYKYWIVNGNSSSERPLKLVTNYSAFNYWTGDLFNYYNGGTKIPYETFSGFDLYALKYDTLNPNNYLRLTSESQSSSISSSTYLYKYTYTNQELPWFDVSTVRRLEKVSDDNILTLLEAPSGKFAWEFYDNKVWYLTSDGKFRTYNLSTGEIDLLATFQVYSVDGSGIFKYNPIGIFRIQNPPAAVPTAVFLSLECTGSNLSVSYICYDETNGYTFDRRMNSQGSYSSSTVATRLSDDCYLLFPYSTGYLSMSNRSYVKVWSVSKNTFFSLTDAGSMYDSAWQFKWYRMIPGNSVVANYTQNYNGDLYEIDLSQVSTAQGYLSQTKVLDGGNFFASCLNNNQVGGIDTQNNTFEAIIPYYASIRSSSNTTTNAYFNATAECSRLSLPISSTYNWNAPLPTEIRESVSSANNDLLISNILSGSTVSHNSSARYRFYPSPSLRELNIFFPCGTERTMVDGVYRYKIKVMNSTRNYLYMKVSVNGEWSDFDDDNVITNW